MRCTADSSPLPSPPPPWRGWLILFILFLALFAATANRGAQWQDSGVHILRVVTGEAVNPRGLALSHPLHHWIARLAVSLDVVEPAFAVTLISALAGALAVANLYGCVLTLTGRWRAAVLAAASLGVAHTFWQMATLAETYTLCTALLTGECWCLAAYARNRHRGHLWGMLLLNGLGVANHLLALLATPVLAFVVLLELRNRRIRVPDLAVGIVLWLVGASPYLGMIAVQFADSGDVAGTLRSALFGRAYADQVLNVSLRGGALLLIAGYIGLNFPNLLLPAAAYGLTGRRPGGVPRLAKRALMAELVIHAAFVLRYNIADQHTFFLPLYALLAIFGGLGFAAVLEWPTRRGRRWTLTATVALLALTPVVYAVLPGIARRGGWLDSVCKHKPYRDDYVYLLAPWSVAENSAERLSIQAVELAGPNGVVLFEDWMAQPALAYRALRAGGNIEVGSAGNPKRLTRVIGDASDSGRKLVLVPGNANTPNTVPPTGSWKRTGDLYVWTTAPPVSATEP